MINVKLNQSYITKIGRVITLSSKDGRWYDSIHCNFYAYYGEVSCIDKESVTFENLKIVEEFPCKLPDCPAGYKWTSICPEFRIPEKYEYFIRYNGETKTFGNVVLCKDFKVPQGCEQRRLIVEPLPKNLGKIVVKEKSTVKEVLAKHKISNDNTTLTIKNPNIGRIPSVVQRYIDKKKRRQFVCKMLNYWIFEPSINLVRNAFVIGIISGGVYTYNHSSEIKSFLYKCVPTISISVDPPNITKG